MISVGAIIILAVLATVAGVSLWRQKLKTKELERLMAHTNDKLERLQLSFGRFTPEEVIEHLTDPDGYYAPNMREVTVLFADLRGFTRMCAEMEADDIVSILNGYFRVMSDVITRHHGRVTEMMGDGLLALFGALRANPWQAQDAVLAALDMRKALEAYNLELLHKGHPQLSFGVGIHRGEVLAGVMGNLELSKFGVVGDTINVAARIESLTRKHGVDILITDAIKQSLDERFVVKAMPATLIKGKDKMVTTFFVEKIEEAQKTPEKV